MACEPNVIFLGECDDIYVSGVVYNDTTDILTVTLNDGTTYTTEIIAAANVSGQANNQILTLSDGLYVAIPQMAVNGLVYQQGDGLIIASADNSVDVTQTKVGTTITVDLSVHPALTVATGVPFSFNATTQALTMPIPELTDNGDDTYTYDPGDGTATITIDAEVCNKLSGCDLNDLGNVSGTPTSGQVLTWSGTAWTPSNTASTATLTDNGDGTYTFDNGGTPVTFDTLSEVTNPFAQEGGTQLTRSDDLTIIESVYRTGDVGVGLTSSDTVRGKHEVRGDAYVTNAGDTASRIYQVNVAGAIKAVTQALNDGASVYQFRTEQALRSLSALDEDGNNGIGEVEALVTLPQNTYGAEGTNTISNYNNNLPPRVPISKRSVTDFTIKV